MFDAPACSRIRRNAFTFIGGVLMRVPYTSNDSSLYMLDLFVAGFQLSLLTPEPAKMILI
jgi:hypothetical protein